MMLVKGAPEVNIGLECQVMASLLQVPSCL